MKTVILFALLGVFCWQSTGSALALSRNIQTVMTGCGRPSETNCTDINYTSTGDLSALATFSGVGCGGSLRRDHGNNPTPLSVQVDDRCKRLKQYQGGSRNTEAEYSEQYDSLRKYIELCANDEGSFHAFPKLTLAVQETNQGDTSRYNRYRDWLISVLYLNTTDPYYFCGDLEAVMGTYGYGKWNIPNASLAIMKYLMDNPYCNDEGLQTLYKNTIRSRHDTWVSRGSDPKHPEDTTLPSLEDLGLGFLLHNTVTPSTALPAIYLASFTSSPNPFKTETTLSFELNRMAYVTVEVFDPLGRKVWGDEHGYSLDKGIHTVHLDGAKFSSGTYYARISTGFGEVKTLKLVKQ